jgi:hypothetical protein
MTSSKLDKGNLNDHFYHGNWLWNQGEDRLVEMFKGMKKTKGA